MFPQSEGINLFKSGHKILVFNTCISMWKCSLWNDYCFIEVFHHFDESIRVMQEFPCYMKKKVYLHKGWLTGCHQILLGPRNRPDKNGCWRRICVAANFCWDFYIWFCWNDTKAFMNIFMLQCLHSDLNVCFHLGRCLGRIFFHAVGVPLKSDLGPDFFISDCPESHEAGTWTWAFHSWGSYLGLLISEHEKKQA